MSDLLDSLSFADTPWPGEWAERGRCRTAPTVVFFPGRGDPVDQAVKICQLCPVITECREYALAVPRLQGVWGGTTAAERERIRETPPPAEPAVPSRQVAARGSMDRLLEQLTGHPGRWARIVSYPSKHSAQAVASLLRNGHRPTPPGRWTFEGRLLPDGTGSALYARYDGPETPVEVAS